MGYLTDKGIGIDSNFIFVCYTDDRGWSITEKWSLANGKRAARYEMPPLFKHK